MNGLPYTPECKDEAVRQLAAQGYSVCQVAERLEEERDILKTSRVLRVHSSGNYSVDTKTAV